MNCRRHSLLSPSVAASALPGEAAADPERVEGVSLQFQRMQAAELQKGDPAGEGFAALTDQLHRSGAEHQEATVGLPLAATGIDQATQLGEKARQALHLIEDHQLVGMALQEQAGLAQAGQVGAGLQIEIEAGGGGGQLQGQGGFAHLTGAEQGHGRKLLQPPSQQGLLQTRNPARCPWSRRFSLQIFHAVP